MEVNQDTQIKTFVVLCIAHSGSSMLAGTMHQMGIHMTKQPEKKDDWHPRGTWERHDFMTMNNKIIDRAVGSWNNPPPLEKILELVNDEKLTEDIKKLVDDNKQELWGWKDPRTCLTIPLWHPYLPDPHYLVLRRDLKAMVGSWTYSTYSSKFGDIGKKEAERIIKYCYYKIDDFIIDKENVIEFYYEEMLENSERELKRLAEFVGGKVNESAFDMVDKKLRHF